LVDMARLLPMAAIGLRVDENDNKGGREQRKLETNIVRSLKKKLKREVN
jgi:hypothetical protein